MQGDEVLKLLEEHGKESRITICIFKIFNNPNAKLTLSIFDQKTRYKTLLLGNTAPISPVSSPRQVSTHQVLTDSVE